MCGDHRASFQVQSVLSFHHVDPRDETQAVRLGNKSFYPLIPLASPCSEIFAQIILF